VGAFKDVILKISDSSAALDNCNKFVKSTELPQRLFCLKSNYSFVSNSIHKLETQEMSLSESIKIIDAFERLSIKVKVKFF
jgi:hypothetical protein